MATTKKVKMTKEQLLKKEIKILKEHISEYESQLAYARERAQRDSEVVADLKLQIKGREGVNDYRVQQLGSENIRLLEIIRWQINPQTAEEPSRTNRGLF